MVYLCYKYIFCGLILFGYVSISKEATTVTKDEANTTDTYDDYGEEELSEDLGNLNDNSPKILQTKSIAQILYESYQQYSKIGTEVHLKCPVKDFGEVNKIMWFKGKSLVNNGNNLIPSYADCCKLDYEKQTLILLNATEKDSGKYKCQLLPEQSFHYIELIVNESSAGTIYLKFELMFITFGLLVFLRIFNQ